MPQASTEHAAPHVTLVGLLDDETRCWRSSRCMKTLRRGGPLRRPVLNGMFHANALVGSMKMLCVGADRRVRPRLTDLLFGIG